MKPSLTVIALICASVTFATGVTNTRSDTLADIARFAQSICDDIPEGSLTRRSVQQGVKARSEELAHVIEGPDKEIVTRSEDIYVGIPFDKLPDKIPTVSMCKSNLVELLLSARTFKFEDTSSKTLTILRSLPLGHSTISYAEFLLGTPRSETVGQKEFEKSGYTIRVSFLTQTSRLGRAGTISGLYLSRSALSENDEVGSVDFFGTWNEELVCSHVNQNKPPGHCLPVVERTSSLNNTALGDFINSDCDDLIITNSSRANDVDIDRNDPITLSLRCSVFNKLSDTPILPEFNDHPDAMIELTAEITVAGEEWNIRSSDVIGLYCYLVGGACRLEGISNRFATLDEARLAKAKLGDSWESEGHDLLYRASVTSVSISMLSAPRERTISHFCRSTRCYSSNPD
jgi:hypothetical protein